MCCAAGGRRTRNMLCLFATTASRTRCFFPTEVRPLGLGRGWALSDCSIVSACIKLLDKSLIMAMQLLDDEEGCEAGCGCLTTNGEWVGGAYDKLI
jgi:hypothetical protein